MNDIQDRNPDKSNRVATILLAVFIFLLPVTYVLSIGPVGWLIHTMEWNIKWIRIFYAFYAPVYWLHDNTFLKEPLEWYTSLFGS